MNKKKNIWIINQYCGSPYHGMNFRSYYLAREFVNRGNSVTVFSGSYSHLFVNPPVTTGLFTDENIDGVDFVWVKTPRYSSSKSVGRIINMLVFMINLFFYNIFRSPKPDTIIISSLSLFPVLNAYIWSRIFKVNFIFEVRDLWPLTLIESARVTKRNPFVMLLSWFERFGYNKARYVVSVLPHAHDYMVSKGMRPDKFKYIPNGISTEEMAKQKDIDSYIIDAIPKNKFIVGYAGTLGIVNALEFLLKAAFKLRTDSDIHFVLVGNGGERDRLRAYCEKNYLENVSFLSAVPKVKVQSLLQYFDVCFIGGYNNRLYKYGISPNKLFDYMYAGKPILHSFSIENNIVSEVGCGISVEAEKPHAIADAILRFTRMDKRELEEMGDRGRAYVVKHHSYSYLAERYLEILGV